MARVPGRGPNKNLEDMLGAVTEFGKDAQQDLAARQIHDATGNGTAGGERMSAVQQASKRRGLSASAMASLVSVIALIFSGFSFYETVLKQASLRLYTPPLIHMFRENYRDVLAIPITISNDGARRGTVLSFDLKVTNLDTKETKSFQNLYFGESPKGDKEMFSPITVPGRDSYKGVVLFHALKTGAFTKTTGGVKLPLRLTLRMNLDRSGGWFDAPAAAPVTFDMTANFIQGFRAMEQGRPTPLHDKRWQNSKAQAEAQ